MPTKEKPIITMDPTVFNGAPCVHGHKVEAIANCFIEGKTLEQVQATYPALTRKDFAAIAKYLAQRLTAKRLFA